MAGIIEAIKRIVAEDEMKASFGRWIRSQEGQIARSETDAIYGDVPNISREPEFIIGRRYPTVGGEFTATIIEIDMDHSPYPMLVEYNPGIQLWIMKNGQVSEMNKNYPLNLKPEPIPEVSRDGVLISSCDDCEGKSVIPAFLILTMAALVLIVFASFAFAAELKKFEPGGSPCDGACPLDWAAPAFGIPIGDPLPMILPAGTIITDGMSYAREGKPFITQQGYYTVRDFIGEGYILADGRWFFKFEACGNWAIADVPFSVSSAMPNSSLLHSAVYSSPSATGRFGRILVPSGGPPDSDNPFHPNPEGPEEPGPEEPGPEEPNPIPVQWSAISLLSAIAGLLFIRRKGLNA